MVKKKSKCSDCGKDLEEDSSVKPQDRIPCPSCGSLSRNFEVILESKIEIKESLKGKARHGEKGRPFLEFKNEDSFYRKAQKWVRRLMRIDRDNNKYSELVIDPESEEIIHKNEETLSAHKGHGSAKNKKA